MFSNKHGAVQFLRFCIVGVGNTEVDLASFLLLTLGGVPYLPAQTLSYAPASPTVSSSIDDGPSGRRAKPTPRRTSCSLQPTTFCCCLVTWSRFYQMLLLRLKKKNICLAMLNHLRPGLGGWGSQSCHVLSTTRSYLVARILVKDAKEGDQVRAEDDDGRIDNPEIWNGGGVAC